VKPITGRAGAKLPKVDFDQTKKEVHKKISRPPTDTDVMSYLMYPQVMVDYEKHVETYSNTAVIPTTQFFYGLQRGEDVNIEIEAGKTLIVKYLTVSEPHEDGTRTVFFELNGQPRDVRVTDRSIGVTLHKAPKADEDDQNQIGAPMPGKISTIAVKKGDAVKEGDRLLSIEAMKMETAVYAPRDATVADVVVKPGTVVAAKDLLVVLESPEQGAVFRK
jgi:pyruvate carboxylase